MDVDAAFGKLPGLSDRPAQRDMATAVAAVLERGGTLLAHAPTGVGKSLGYLVPIVAAGRRATIATATKALQAQLVDRDLPRLADAFGVSFALAMGRGNFACLAKADALVAATRLAATPVEEAALELVEWAAGSDTGSRLDAPPGTRDDAWDLVSTSGEDCPGAKGCAFFRRCFAEKARDRAREVDVVVTNHHLLLLELELRQATDAPGVMLPETDVVVVDEAHRLADHAADLYGVTLSAARVTRAGAAADAVLKAAGGTPEWARRLRGRWEQRAAELPTGEVLPGSMAAERLAEALAPLLRDARAAGAAVRDLALAEQARGAPEQGGAAAAQRRLAKLGFDLDRLVDTDGAAGGGEEAELAVWVEETRGGGRSVRSALVEPGPLLADLLWSRVPSAVACSATLAVAGSLAPAAATLGMEEPAGLLVGSPFDVRRNALLYVPRALPPPGAGERFQAAAAEELTRLVAASRGRALVLCTSWRAVVSFAPALAELPYELLVQGDDSPGRLAARFREEVGSVLLGTRTFFEGIDVPGESLSLLVLDKLPFPWREDPLLVERGRRAERRGGSSFNAVWLPRAAVSLQQALGRLLRSETDRGVMAVLDRRLADAGYGAVLRASLPPAPLTRSLDDVRAFFDG